MVNGYTYFAARASASMKPSKQMKYGRLGMLWQEYAVAALIFMCHCFTRSTHPSSWNVFFSLWYSLYVLGSVALVLRLSERNVDCSTFCDGYVFLTVYMLTNGKFGFFSFRLCSRLGAEFIRWLRVHEHHSHFARVEVPACLLVCACVVLPPNDSIRLKCQSFNHKIVGRWLFTHAGNDVIFDSTHTQLVWWLMALVSRTSSTAAINTFTNVSILLTGWMATRSEARGPRRKAHGKHQSHFSLYTRNVSTYCGCICIE